MIKNLHKIKFTKVLEGIFRDVSGKTPLSIANKGYCSRAAIGVNALKNATREGMRVFSRKGEFRIQFKAIGASVPALTYSRPVLHLPLGEHLR